MGAREKNKARQSVKGVGKLEDGSSYPQLAQRRASDKATSQPSPEGSECMSQVVFQGENILYRGNSTCEGLEEGL